MVTQQGLQLHLKLDELTKKGNEVKVPDTSGFNNDGLVYGGATIVPDDQFGSSMHFDGKDDWVELPSKLQLKGTFSISCWVSTAVGTSKNQCFIGKHNESGGNQFLVGIWKKKLAVQIMDKPHYFDGTLPSVNKWFHLAVTIEKKADNQSEITVYIDGKLFDKVTVAVALNDTSGKPWVIGQDWDGGSKTSDFFNGHMTEIKLYDKLISQEEIQANISDSQNALTIFKSTYPLDFTLTENDVQNVLYISNTNDGVNEIIDLEISNTSSKTILFKPLTETNAPQYHLELRFRPNTFENSIIEEEGKEKWQFINNVKAPSSWKVSNATLHPVNNTVSLFFTYLGQNELQFQTEEVLNFSFEYGSADGQKGGRGTQVMLAYQQIQYIDNVSALSGTRNKQVDIINQRGKKNIPLHLGFVGSNTVLNDTDAGGSYQGTSSTLKIRLFNTLKKGSLRFNTSKNTDNKSSQSKLTISFDNVDDERALASANELAGINVKTINNWATITKKLQSSLPTIELDNFSIEELLAGESLDIELKDVRSSKPSGFSNIYFRYEDFPGYWDGEFVMVVEKTPIIHRNIGNEKHVGIGVMPDKTYQMKLGGNLKIEPDPDDQEMLTIGTKDGKKKYLTVNKKGKLGLNITTGDFKKQSIDLAIGDNDTGFKQQGDGELAVYTNNKERARFDNGGNLGIGTNDPKDKLHVNGRIQDQTGYLMPPGTILPFAGPKSAIPKGFLPCDGKLVSKSTYKDLYKAISNSWGTSGNNFRVPDLRGYFLRGVAEGKATDPDRNSRKSVNGSKSKDNVGSYQDDAIISHKHTGKTDTKGNHTHSVYAYNGGGINSKNHNNWVIYNDDGPKKSWKGKTNEKGNHSHNLVIGKTGGYETRPKNVYVWYMIKY